MSRDVPRLSRRDALRSIGAGGAAYTLGPSGATARVAAQSSGTAGREVVRDHAWTESVGNTVSREEDYDMLTNYSGHLLTYLDASWEPIGSPAVTAGTSDGCWRHTFALVSVGTTGVDQNYPRSIPPGLPYSSVSVNVPSIGDDHPSRQYDGGIPEAHSPSGTAVSARRHPSLFSFVERSQFVTELRNNDVDPETVTTPATASGDIHDELLDKRAAVESDGLPVESPSPIGTVATALGLHTSSTPSKVVKLATRASVAASVLDVLYSFYDAVTVEQKPRADRGFATAFPEETYTDSDEYVPNRTPFPDQIDFESTYVNTGSEHLYYGAGGHYLVFDVLEAPAVHGPSVVDVVSRFGDGDLAGGWSIVLDTPAPDGGDPATVSPAERFSATPIQSDAVTTRDPNKEVTN